MSIKEERAKGWGLPALIAALLLVIFIVWRFGSWIIYGIQTAGTKRDIVITIDEDLSEFRTDQSQVGFYVDIDKKLIFMELNDYSQPGNKYEALKFLDSHKKKVLKKAKISDDDVNYLLSIARSDYKPKHQTDKVREDYLQSMQKLTLEYNTDRIENYYATVTVYRYDIEDILDRFENEYEEDEEEE